MKYKADSVCAHANTKYRLMLYEAEAETYWTPVEM